MNITLILYNPGGFVTRMTTLVLIDAMVVLLGPVLQTTFISVWISNHIPSKV